MKRLWTAGALVAIAIMGAGCSGCALLDPNRGVLTETVTDEHALWVAEAAYTGFRSAAEAAVDSGALVKDSPLAVQIASADFRAYTALQAARAAYVAGDAKSIPAKIAAVQNLVAVGWALIPNKEV